MVKHCENCGKEFEAGNPNAQPVKRFCTDKCRYDYWKNKKERELEALVKQLAGRSSLPKAEKARVRP